MAALGMEAHGVETCKGSIEDDSPVPKGSAMTICRCGKTIERAK